LSRATRRYYVADFTDCFYIKDTSDKDKDATTAATDKDSIDANDGNNNDERGGNNNNNTMANTAPKKTGAAAGGKKAFKKNSGGRKSTGENQLTLTPPPFKEEAARCRRTLNGFDLGAPSVLTPYFPPQSNDFLRLGDIHNDVSSMIGIIFQNTLPRSVHSKSSTVSPCR